MTTKTEILSFLSGNKKLFSEKFHISKVGLFGSYARNEFTENSDIDVIIEFDSSAQHIFEYKYQFRELLKNTFQKEIDLCREKSIRSDFKSFILKDTIYI
jgi:uncharacterized protein